MILPDEDRHRFDAPPEYTSYDRSEYDGDTFDEEPQPTEPTTDTP